MKDKFDNIEDLFKESFEHFEADVDPNMWSNISTQISANPGTAGQAGNAASGSSAGTVVSGVVKVAAIIGAAGALTYGGFQVFKSNDQPAEQIVVEETPKNVIVEEITTPLMSEPIREDEVSIPAEKSLEQEKVIVQEKQVNPSIEEEVVEPTPVSAAPVPGTTASQNKSDQTPVSPAKQQAPQKEEKAVPAKQEQTQSAPKSNLKAVIYASSDKGNLPLEVRFENRGSQSDQIIWKFRDNGQRADYNFVNHTFEKPGKYWVVLEISNADGSISKDSMEIEVLAPSLCQPPFTSFTPNGDGSHDAFMIECDQVQSVHGRIFSRMGQLIYEWNKPFGHWDGRDMQGNIMPTGAYMFVIEVTGNDGIDREPIKGTVNLYR